ncbi:hypothetical protein [Brachyspira aalborgi]|uniref:ImmA/IrrE family metallo-endopeptidase n=1 Tax=Brachyspira aalborgi TaxID=29522 RepID=A0A5C8G585_9SPIR|nr:hypothetical protein [Brachyspira aalborgi]TXJ57061.1 hypothetical protein EPJ76_02975 [Brachyspira aalborgi]
MLNGKSTSIYDKDFLKEVYEKTKIDINIINNLSEEFKNILQPEIEDHYLSHLVSSIETIINKEKVNSFLKSINKNLNLNEEDRRELLNFVVNNKFRFYPILLRKTKGLPLPASVDFMWRDNIQSEGAIIYYSAEITDKKQLRIFIAHELGHIYFETISKIKRDNDKYSLEDYSNLFALFTIIDKDNFYNYRCKELTEENTLTSINSILSILSQVYRK